MPRSAKSRATALVSISTAPLLAVYSVSCFSAARELIEPMLTMEPPRSHQRWHRVLASQEDALDVDIESALVLIYCGRHYVVRQQDAGVVDDAVHPPVHRDGEVHRAGDVPLVRDVEGARCPPVTVELVGQPLGARTAGRGGHDGRAVIVQVPGSRTADPAGRASDQDDLAVKGFHRKLQSQMNIVDNRLPQDGELVKTAPNFVLHISRPRLQGHGGPLVRRAPISALRFVSCGGPVAERRASWPRGRRPPRPAPIRAPWSGCGRRARAGSAPYHPTQSRPAGRGAIPQGRSTAGTTGDRRPGTGAIATPTTSTHRRAPGYLRHGRAGRAPPDAPQCCPVGLLQQCARSAHPPRGPVLPAPH